MQVYFCSFLKIAVEKYIYLKHFCKMQLVVLCGNRAKICDATINVLEMYP